VLRRYSSYGELVVVRTVSRHSALMLGAANELPAISTTARWSGHADRRRDDPHGFAFGGPSDGMTLLRGVERVSTERRRVLVFQSNRFRGLRLDDDAAIRSCR